MSETDEKTWTTSELIEYARLWNPRTGLEKHPLNILCTRLEEADAKLAELGKMDLYTFKPIVWVKDNMRDDPETLEWYADLNNFRLIVFRFRSCNGIYAYNWAVQVMNKDYPHPRYYNFIDIIIGDASSLKSARSESQKAFRAFIMSALLEV